MTPTQPNNHDDKLKAVMKALGRISWMAGFPEKREHLESISGAYSRFVRTTTVHHEQLGDVVPLDWLVQEIAATCTRFPMPITARKIYEAHFPSVDGQSAEQLEDRMQGGVW